MSKKCLSLEPVSYTHLDVYKRQLLQSGRSNSEIAYWLSRAYPHEIETLNLETGDIADYRTTAQGMELEVLDAEEKRLAVLYFRWDEVAPLLRGMYARQLDGFGQEQPEPSAEAPTFHSETVAVYPGDKNNLPYDVVVERLHIEEPEPPTPACLIFGSSSFATAAKTGTTTELPNWR